MKLPFLKTEMFLTEALASVFRWAVHDEIDPDGALILIANFGNSQET